MVGLRWWGSACTGSGLQRSGGIISGGINSGIISGIISESDSSIIPIPSGIGQLSQSAEGRRAFGFTEERI
eukprot:SAG22_NODE_9292_length_598_cov_1.234469_1_plen_71_part_00